MVGFVAGIFRPGHVRRPRGKGRQHETRTFAIRSQPMNKLRLLVLVFALCAARPAHAVKVWSSGDSWLYVGILLQPNMQVIEDAAPVANSHDASTEFALRRFRVLIFGNVTKNFSFFFESDE